MRCDFDLKLDVIPESAIDVLDFITNNPGQDHHVCFAILRREWSVAEFQGDADGRRVRAKSSQKPLGITLQIGTWLASSR